jgi:hypothetical protein
MKFSPNWVIARVYRRQGGGCAECGALIMDRPRHPLQAYPIDENGRATVANCVILCTESPNNCSLNVAKNGSADLRDHYFPHMYDGVRRVDHRDD